MISRLSFLSGYPRYLPGYLHILALLAGGALPFAFAPFEWRWLAFVSLAMLFFLWSQGSVRVVVLRSFLFGIGMFAVGVYWVYYSLHLFGDAIAPLALIITVGFIGLFALFIALSGWLVARFFPSPASTRGRVVWFVTVAPAVWALCEIFRGWFLTGFPWLSVGYSQIDTPLVGYAPILGVYGVSWLAAICAGLTYLSIAERYKVKLLALCVVVLIGFGGFLLGKVEWSEPHGDPIKIRLVQGNIEQHHKFMADLLTPSIEMYKRLSETSEDIDLIVWPESAIPTFFFRIDKSLRDFTVQKSAEGTQVLTGGFVFDREKEVYYNSLRMLDDPDAYYHKKHLVPFGEFIPFRSALAFLSKYIAIPMSDLSSGTDGGKGLVVNGQVIGASICYEDAFGEEIIRQLPEANLLLNVSNDSWFGDSSAPYQHLEIAKMRAVETARPMVRVTNTGVSAVIDYRGRIYSLLGVSQSIAVNVSIQPRMGATLYVKNGNLNVLILVLFVLIIGCWFCRTNIRANLWL